MKKAFVIGHPIKHSRSPLIHRYWLDRYGIEGSYEAIDVAPAELPAFFGRLRSGEFVGGNVTLPHKETVLALCDDVDELAHDIGAVNTLVLKGGRIFGFNTDMEGFLKNLDDQRPGWAANPGSAVVLGAGGASRPVIAGLKQRGFWPIEVLNRTTGKKIRIGIEDEYVTKSLDTFQKIAPTTSFVANTSSVGLDGTSFSNFSVSSLPKSTVVTDIVYAPINTQLLVDAQKEDLNTVDGLGMLLHQAVPGFEAWFGVRPEVTAELRAKIEATL